MTSTSMSPAPCGLSYHNHRAREWSRPTIRDGCQVSRCTEKFSANSRRATAFQFTARSRELQVANREFGTIERSAIPAISKSGWTPVAKFDSISASIRISTTDTQ